MNEYKTKADEAQSSLSDYTALSARLQIENSKHPITFIKRTCDHFRRINPFVSPCPAQVILHVCWTRKIPLFPN